MILPLFGARSDDRATVLIAEMTATAYYRTAWLRDNPTLAPLVQAYLAGGERPSETQIGRNHYGRALVLAEDIRRNG